MQEICTFGSVGGPGRPTGQAYPTDKIADFLADDKLVEAVTFDPDEEVIVRWIP